ncbi:MAG TPA: DUF6089 family protein [Saprospiraceae bacterium]|nr:DUF6089 family protein [Saprospiraceae bacterium]
MTLRVRLVCLKVLIFSALGNVAFSQGDIGIILGISNYQGELASYSTANGFNALVGPVFGVHGGYALNPRFQLRGDLLYTRLSGDDAINDKEITRMRNLNFFTPVVQLAGGIDWNVLGFDVRDAKAFTPYATAGASLFYMNPMTTYEGKKIALRPLGTEGQYLDDYPEQKPYNRLQPSLQFGGGLKLLTGGFIIALEAMLSYTFTDYIDDVSTIYITYPELYEKAGPLTAALANRTGEYLGTEPVVLGTGSLRGNPENKDLFGVITLRLGIPLEFNSKQVKVRGIGSKTVKCPKF